MLVRRVAIENVRSFLDRTELTLDGPISIVIGPNGGGKTNLLDTIVIMLRKFLFASMYAAHAPTVELPDRHEFRANDVLNNMILERHSRGAGRDQIIEMEIEVTAKDVENMRLMQADANRLTELAKKKYFNVNLERANAWTLSDINEGARFTYQIVNGQTKQDQTPACNNFLQYLQMFEMDGKLRDEFEIAPLATPLIYLPVNRGAAGFQSSVELAGYNDFETKRHSDGASSRSAPPIMSLAVGRMAQKFRMLLEKDNGIAAREFHEDSNLKQLTELLRELGYEWSLESVNPLKNQYDIRLKKQGSSFLVGAASSGERELLIYLFAIFALNVRDALIIVDEPELHLHPKWQKTLLQLFIRLAHTTGNQFLLATHSPTFVSPDSIQFVSRVFSHEQMSHILRLNTTALPEAKHLLHIVNSQNNERLFFADKVTLVEGLSDRMFFESVLDHYGRSTSNASILEVISVGGKGLFEAYGRLLRACAIKYSIVADLDYVEQIGTPEIKGLLTTNSSDIKADVIDNVKSIDGESLVIEIERAMSTNNWDHAKHVWDYIKSRRRRLRQHLSASEESALDNFLTSKRVDGIFILRLGALECYLPAGHGSKDLDKLIRLLAKKDFVADLPGAARPELETIANALIAF